MSSDAKHEGYLGPNDPEYYAPRELRERAAGEQPSPSLVQNDGWRPRMPTEGPPLQPFGKPARRQDSEMFTKAVAQAMQEARDMAPVEAPSVLRDLSGRRALVPAGHPFLDRGGDCSEHRDASRHGHSVFATPRRPGRVAFGRLAVGQIVGDPGAAAAGAAEAYGDPCRAGRQRVHQRSGAARHSRRRSAARRFRIHQRTDGGLPPDVGQTYRRRRMARAGDGDFRRFGHSAGRIRRPDAGDSGIA